MSLVISFLSQDYLLFCGDTKVVRDNGTVGLCEKVHIFNNIILWGFTGNVLINIDPFRIFLGDDGNIDFNKTQNITFDELDYHIQSFYNRLNSEYITSGIIPNFNCIIGGFNNGNFITKNYSLIKKKRGIFLDISENNFLKHTVMGEPCHQNVLEDLLPPCYQSVEELIDIFQKIIDIGIYKDNTINNKMTAVYLKRSETYKI